MGQVGLHAITGLVVGQHLLTSYVEEPSLRKALLFGFVMGNIVPDLDFLSVVGMYPHDPEMALHMHRGYTHSLLGATTIIMGFYLAGVIMKDSYVRYLGYGLALGHVVHFTSDIFLWFTPVDIFWPSSVFGVIPPIDLWYWYDTPPLLGRLMGAAEFAAFAFYYQYLIGLTKSLGTNPELLQSLQRMVNASWLVWCVTSAMAVDLSETQFIMFMYIPMGVIFMPACYYLTWRAQQTIEVLAVPLSERPLIG
jgi:membrane-bound metal-dependent hydrolase YbcI (DUF457 family)